MVYADHLHLRYITVGTDSVVCCLIETTVDSTIVHDNDNDGQLVANHRLDFHAAETECRITLNTDDFFARMIIATV